MNLYGFFDEDRREYVITDPLPPRPWINYLGTGKLGAFVSQGAGGLAWHGQALSRRISRYEFMALPQDRPGFYVYIREEDGTYWNPSFQPVQTLLTYWECRHGMGYTRFNAGREGLDAELEIFVPASGEALLLDLKITNRRNEAQKLFITNYLEFSLFEYFKEIIGWIVLRNQVRFTWDEAQKCIFYDYFVHEAEYTDLVFVSGSGGPDCFDCSRDAFIGRGRSAANPVAVADGKLSGSQLSGGGIGIGAVGYHRTIEPGASERIVWSIGMAGNREEAVSVIRRYRELENVDRARRELAAFWNGILGSFRADIPDAPLRNMINIWNPYGAYVTLFRDRDISSELPGFAAGIRFRDAMQNVMSVCNLAPAAAAPRINLILAHQRSDGSAPNAFYPGGKGEKKDAGEPRCDSPVWSPITVYGYLAETGDPAYLEKELPYLDGSSGTVYEHLLAGLFQIARDSGDNGLPLLKGRDWDDHLGLFSEEGAESVMTAQNWCYAGRLMREICLAAGAGDDARRIDEQIRRYTTALNGPAWDGEWYRQVLFRSGKTALGSRERAENKIYINTQAWAVISETAPDGRGVLCMDKMREYLDTPYGIRFLTPPYTGIPEPHDRLISNGPGLGENGGVFIQANCWAIMAETMLGRGDLAYEYYRKIAPPVVSETVGPDICLNEPYMYSSHIIAEPDPRRGMGNLSWLTGTVNWMYIAATQHILGIRPVLDGLRIAPCIPRSWPGFRVKRKFRNTLYDIEVVNRRSGALEIELDGRLLDGNVLPPQNGGTCSVKVFTGDSA